jgi:peroxiredoxin
VSPLTRRTQRIKNPYGAAPAAELAGEKEKAKSYSAKIIALCERSDTARPELRHARAFLGQQEHRWEPEASDCLTTSKRREPMRFVVTGLAMLLWGQTVMADPIASLVQAAGLRAVGEPQPAADFQLPDLDGQLLRLHDQRGKVVLLNFWATWCPPCLHEMPLMDQLYQALRQRPFVLWAVAMKEDRDKVAPFMDKHRFQFMTLLDRDGAVSARYKLRGLPTTYLIDCRGNTMGWSTGPQEWTSDAVRTLLTALLSDPNCG